MDLKTFEEGIKELLFENRDLVDKIFHSANSSLSGFLSWEEFLRAMKIIFTQNLETKVTLFFKIIDSDGNGLLSSEEVFEICKMSLSRFEKKEVEDFIDEMARNFTRFIF